MDECKHEHEQLRKLIASNGVEHFKMQCMECGRAGPSKKRADLTQVDMDDAPLLDRDIQRRYWEKRSASARAQYEQNSMAMMEERRARMDRYYRSERWHMLRARVLKRDGYMCQAQLACCSGRATQVHHLTYDHFENEPLFDLISICKECHDAITTSDRQRHVDRTVRGIIPVASYVPGL